MINISLKINRIPNADGEYPLYVRIRGKNADGKLSETLITTGIFVDEKHFVKGAITPRTPNYTDKTRIINGIHDDLNRIISETIEMGLQPNPKFVKKRYEEAILRREHSTPQIQTFWKGYDEYLDTKKNTTWGYQKTLITLRNHLLAFESHIGRKLTYEYVGIKTVIFQSEFNDYMWEKNDTSNAYLNKLYGNLSGYMHFCHQMNYISKKPKFRMESVIRTDEKVYLRAEEVKKLFKSTKWDYDPTKEEKLLANPHIVIIEQELLGTRAKTFDGMLKVTNWELVKDIFLFQNSIGCRIGDTKHFVVNDMNFDKEQQLFSWIQHKTKDRVSVPLNDIGGEIFKKYSAGKSLKQLLFPSISQQKFNKQLKFLLKDLKFNRMIARPKIIGSKMVDVEERPLWELISSHSGRRGFIKNAIDMGTMDQYTIMKLSGHSSPNAHLRYVSVTSNDTMKVKGLYRDDNESVTESDKFLSEFNKLSDNKKKMVMDLIHGLQS